MRIHNSTVRRIAYATRVDILKVSVEPLNPKPLISTKPLPNVEGKCGVGWRAYNPLPEGIRVHTICQMPLIVGRQKRDHRKITPSGAVHTDTNQKRWKVEPNYNPSLRDHRGPEVQA